MTDGVACLSLVYIRERDCIRNLQTDEEIPFRHFARLFAKIADVRREDFKRGSPSVGDCIT